jgi:hypothetical protein
MNNSLLLRGFLMGEKDNLNQSLAAEITWAASKQTYYTIRFLVARG